jgi:hypothetical protein
VSSGNYSYDERARFSIFSSVDLLLASYVLKVHACVTQQKCLDAEFNYSNTACIIEAKLGLVKPGTFIAEVGIVIRPSNLFHDYMCTYYLLK